MQGAHPGRKRAHQVLGEDFDAARPLQTTAEFLRIDIQNAIAQGELPPGSYALRVHDPNPPDHPVDPDPTSCRNNWGLVVRPRDHTPGTLRQLWALQSRYNCSWPRLQDVEDLPEGERASSYLAWFGWFHWWVEVPSQAAGAAFEAFRAAE